MPERAIDELIERLKSDDPMDQVFAAEELGERGDPVAVAPLIEALSRLSYESDAEFSFATAILEALASLRGVEATEAILDALERTCGHDVVPERACDVLVELRATAAVSTLKRLLRDEEFSEHAGELARAVAELGGPGEAPFFLELLNARHQLVKAAAAEALGRLEHLAAAPALAKLLESKDDDTRLAALGALIAMNAPGAGPALRAQMDRASGYFEKRRILGMIADDAIASAADLLVAKSKEPAWADSDTMLVETLGVAGRLGSTEAAARLRQLSQDTAQSPCTRAAAAAALLDLDCVELLPACLDFLSRNGGHAEKDLRDSFGRSNETQMEMVSALERFAARHRESLLPIVDCLNALRHERCGNPRFIQERAGRAVRALTRTER